MTMNQTQNKKIKKEQNNNKNNDMLKHLIFRWATQLNEINNENKMCNAVQITNKTRKEMLKTLTNLGYFDN